ncbi:MAG TPA: APC family permease [Micromonosporaceae bacterium]|jgi:APA family basic amino acid/polyamine antiporter|nr:APC family permease [Micromonosporaceae bacterium]
MSALARRLGVTDAVVIGLGSMLGAGVFVVFAPATALAGGAGMLLALGVAGFVAFCNATSSARLAARYPESGGAYVYGRERLGDFAGFLAGWGFLVGKTASCTAMALTIGDYLLPEYSRLVAVASVVAVTTVNLRGIGKTALATRILVGLTLSVLALVVVTGLVAGGPAPDRIGGSAAGSWYGVLGAAGLLFFAFAGYARVATLGEEVRDPERTIPRAVPIALGLVLVSYALVGVTALLVLGPQRLAASAAPLAVVVAVAGFPPLVAVVRIGATIAVFGVLLSLSAGVARTAYAMARRRDLPGSLDAVHPASRVPHRAELAVALAVVTLVLVGDLREAIGFSSFTVLVYYAIANLSALTMGRTGGVWRQVLAGAGLAGCVILAVTLPVSSVLSGAAVLAAGVVWYLGWPRIRRTDHGVASSRQ